MNYRLFIATNKRSVPTLKILQKLKWKPLFESVICIDSLNIKNLKKSDMINHIITSQKLPRSNVYYIGDQEADYVAAKESQVYFLLSNWDPDHRGSKIITKNTYKSPLDLLAFFSDFEMNR